MPLLLFTFLNQYLKLNFKGAFTPNPLGPDFPPDYRTKNPNVGPMKRGGLGLKPHRGIIAM